MVSLKLICYCLHTYIDQTLKRFFTGNVKSDVRQGSTSTSTYNPSWKLQKFHGENGVEISKKICPRGLWMILKQCVRQAQRPATVISSRSSLLWMVCKILTLWPVRGLLPMSSTVTFYRTCWLRPTNLCCEWVTMLHSVPKCFSWWDWVNKFSMLKINSCLKCF